MACNAGWSASSGASWAAIARRQSASAAAGSSTGAGAADDLRKIPMPEPLLVQPLCRINGGTRGPGLRVPSAAAIKNRHSRRKAVTPVATPHAHAEAAPVGDEGSEEDATSGLPAPEGRGAGAHDDPYAVDPYDADPYDSDED